MIKSIRFQLLKRWFGIALFAVMQTVLFAPLASVHGADSFEPLFNGQNLDGWYTWDDRYKKNNDVENYFQVRNGELVILDIPESEDDKAFGYISTTDDYENYHLRFEYQWGEKKFAPRANKLRDSGLLYHLVGDDRLWPTSLESQVQEGDTGDFFGLGGARIESTRDGTDYSPTGDFVSGGNQRASSVADTLTGWNVSEVIVRGDSAVHIVNGEVVNRLWNSTAGGRPLISGRIAFQAEGATIRYRNIELRELGSSRPKLLIFTETRDFRHTSIPAAVAAVEELAASVGIDTDVATDSEDVFTDSNLADYDAVVWLMTSGDVLNNDEQAVFEHYIRSGGGYAGVHAASDTEHNWPWYSSLVGAYFDTHPTIQQATQIVEDDSHPSTTHLGSTWTRRDEWYDYSSNPRSRVNVLLRLDEDSYTGGRMGRDHPSAWYHEFDGGRSWYTGGGHTIASYSEEDFRLHLLGGLVYATGIDLTSTQTRPTSNAPQIPADAVSRVAWTAIAAGSNPRSAIDGNQNTRWTTSQLQTAGMRFDIDFGEVIAFDGIVLDAGEAATDYPRGYEVLVSDNGINFTTPIASGSGSGRGTVINFPAVSARYLRIVQTGSDSLRWWSIHELNVSGAEAVAAVATPDGDVGGEQTTDNTDPAGADSNGPIDSTGTAANNTDSMDSDGDGLPDGVETAVTLTNPSLVDTDNDGLSDGEEVNTYGTDPTNQDTDAGGSTDGEEVAAGSNPADATDDVVNLDTDNDGIPNAIDGNGDQDADGVANYLDLDSDNDGLSDLVEAGGTDTDNDGMVDNSVDANNDGLDDTLAANPLPLTDTDGDQLANYLDLDSDQDSLADLSEAGGADADNNGVVDNFTDADGNGMDDTLTQSPLPVPDTDLDGSPDYLDLDSDNNETYDLVEAGGVDSDNDGTVDLFKDSDADGIPDSADASSNIAQADTDNDGIIDSADIDQTPLGADVNANGILDSFEADPDGDGRATAVASATTVNTEAPGVLVTGISGGIPSCSIAGGASKDPLLPGLFLLSGMMIFWRRKRMVDPAVLEPS